MAYKDEEARKC